LPQAHGAVDRALSGEGERAVLITLLAIILPGLLLAESLAHYARWSFAARIGLTVGAMLLAQYLAGRFFNRGAAQAPRLGKIAVFRQSLMVILA
jgi:hypothetical protein